jgi:phospholipid/cholesterol/gamma-HCH transport system substrate-binding protein
MNERVMQFRVGVVVLFTTIIAGVLVTLYGPLTSDWVPGLDRFYQVKIELDQAPGIGPGTPVLKNGLLIGRVASVEDKQDHILVIANIDKGRQLFPNYDCVVRTTVLGDASIEFIARPAPPERQQPPQWPSVEPTSDAAGPTGVVTPVADQNPPAEQPVGPGYVFQGHAEPNPLDAVAKFGELEGDLKQMIDALKNAGDQVALLSARVNEAIGNDTEPGRVPQILDKAEVALEDFSRASQKVENFFDDPHLRAMAVDTRRTLQDVSEAAERVNTAATSAQTNLKNLEGFTEPLGRRGESIANALIDNLDGLGRVVEELTVLVESVNNREGTIGKLIHNPEVYDNLNRVLVNTNNVVLRVNDLAARLRVVIEDVRVFTDKIAREPGRLVGGALNRGPGLK